ncbi:hypothetical protein Efla_006607 [Eimeria flavescens]
MPAESSQRWLARTFAPYILVGGSEVAKREVALLTGLSLACLFQPFNGEVLYRVQDRVKLRASSRVPPPPQADLVSDGLSEDDEGFTPEQLDPASSELKVAPKVPPLSLQLRVECASVLGSSSTKSNAAASTPLKRRSRSFCVRFMNLDEAEAVSCIAVESLAARSLLLASPSVSELREQMHAGLPSDAGHAAAGVGGGLPSFAKGASLGVELPWYEEWRRVIFEGSRFSPHETLSQPVGLILFVSTRDPDPVAALDELLMPSNLPQMCRQYILDPNPVRAVILLDVHPDAYAARLNAAFLKGPNNHQGMRGGSSTAGEGGGADGASAAEASPTDRAPSSRSKEVMERLCAVFPPAHCHLLTLGRGCTAARHLQLLPAIRHLYAQSLSFCFHPALSGNLLPTLLAYPSPAHTQAAAAADTSAASQEQRQQLEDLLRADVKLPVAARLTTSSASSTSPPKGAQQQQQQPHQNVEGSPSCFDAACLGCSFCVGLAWQDLQWLGAFVRHFVSASIVSWAEQRIRQLDGSISSNRKGFRNQLRYLWRKPKAVAAATTPSAAADAVAGLAAAAEEAGGAAEALLSAVGGAFLGDSSRSLVSAASNGTPSEAGEAKANGGGTPTSPSSSANTGYVLHAIEWQYRLLGDLSLFFGQTENALQSYRSCAADFKQDKRWVHLGGAHEMCAVALHATGGPRREVESYIEQAYNAYVKAGMGRLALRCVLLGHRLLMEGASGGSSGSSLSGSSSSTSSSASSFLQLPHVLHLPLMIGGGSRASDVSAEVARRLIAANAELPSLDASMWQQQQQQQAQGVSAIQAQSQAIRSAMLLEQAAVCLEQAGPSHWRKRNFQLVMAGHTYYKAGYKRFALRCYLHVFEGYEVGGWHHVAQHLRFIMARQTFSLHLLEESILHFLGLLNGLAMLHECRILAGCGGAGLPFIPPERQSHYVREFLFVCRVLLERQRLALKARGNAETEALANEPTGHAGSRGQQNEKEEDGFVALHAELRVPVLQLRDSLGLFRDSVGVYLVGDAMLPDTSEEFNFLERPQPLPAASHQLLSFSRESLSSVPSYETLGKLISGVASLHSIQELRVQERLWDRLLFFHLRNGGFLGSSGCGSTRSGQEASCSFKQTESHFNKNSNLEAPFVSHPVYESLRRQTTVGLPVTVKLRVVNPLDLQVEINNLRLFGNLLPSPSASTQGASAATEHPHKDDLLSQDDGRVEFSTANLQLGPTASATIRLTATPLSPGRLCLLGMTEATASVLFFLANERNFHASETVCRDACRLDDSPPPPRAAPLILRLDVVLAVFCQATPNVYLLCMHTGVVGELFGLVQASQHFCLHGAQRAERQFDLRHCRLDLVSGEETMEADGGPPDGGPYLLQQRLNLIRQLLTAAPTEEVKAQLSRALQGLPLFYALGVEGFRMLHTGSPVQVCRWDSRSRMAETHKPDLRLELEVSDDVVFLDCRFVGWPSPQSLLPPAGEHADDVQQAESADAQREALMNAENFRDAANQSALLAGQAERLENFPSPSAAAAAAAAGSSSAYSEAPWMLAGEQRECFLLVRNASSSLALAGLTVAVFPQDIVSVTAASIFSDKKEMFSELQQQQQQQSAVEEAVEAAFAEGLPLQVVTLKPTCNSSRMAQADASHLSSISLFSLLPAVSAAIEGGSAASDAGELPAGSLVPPGATACLRLSVRAAYGGLHRVRFCLRGQPLQQQQKTTEASAAAGAAAAAGEGGKLGNARPAWRAVEALLVVAPSLELRVQPRLSWTDPSNILLLCRVTNHSPHRLRISGLVARGFPTVQHGLQQQLRGGDAEEEDAALDISKAAAVQAADGSEAAAAAVPLVAYRGTEGEGGPSQGLGGTTFAKSSQSIPRTLEPKDELLLLYAPQDAQRLRRLAQAADGRIHVTLQWVLCDPESDSPINASSTVSYSAVRTHAKRTGAIMSHRPISLETSTQGLPLELTVSPSPASCQRFIKWTPEQPCTCEVTFSVRNISKSQHLRLRLRAESRGQPFATHAEAGQQQADSSAACAAANAALFHAEGHLRPFSGDRRAWSGGPNAFDSLHAAAKLAPVCLPVVATEEDAQQQQQQKVLLPDCCYNDDIAARLGSRILSRGSQAVFSPALEEEQMDGGVQEALPPATLALSRGLDGRAEPLLHAKDGDTLQAATASGDTAQPHSPTDAQILQKRRHTATHADLARQAQQPAARSADTPGSPQAPQGGGATGTSDGCCVWLGKVAYDAGVLPPGAAARAAFTALFPKPGVYNLNTVKAQVELVADEAARETDGKRREFGGPNRRIGLQRRYRGPGGGPSPAANWPPHGAPLNVSFPLDFLVHVVPGDSA